MIHENLLILNSYKQNHSQFRVSTILQNRWSWTLAHPELEYISPPSIGKNKSWNPKSKPERATLTLLWGLNFQLRVRLWVQRRDDIFQIRGYPYPHSTKMTLDWQFWMYQYRVNWLPMYTVEHSVGWVLVVCVFATNLQCDGSLASLCEAKVFWFLGCKILNILLLDNSA